MNAFLAQFKQAIVINSGEKPPEDLAMSFEQPQSHGEAGEFEPMLSDNMDAEELWGRDNQIDSSARRPRACTLRRRNEGEE